MSSKPQTLRAAARFGQHSNLLNSFSSSRMTLPSPGSQPGNDDLWKSEAVHRAKNLAQLASSLSHIKPDNLGLEVGLPLRPEGEVLAAAYVELAADGCSRTFLPCAGLLQRICITLASLSAKRTTVLICPHSDDVYLASDCRRALILIASELVINSLKYAFPGDRSGTIRVSLARIGDHARLVVEDDGVGFQNMSARGTGSDLVAAMSSSLGGFIERSDRPQGGARVAVWFPLGAQAAPD